MRVGAFEDEDERERNIFMVADFLLFASTDQDLAYAEHYKQIFTVTEKATTLSITIKCF